MPKAKVQLSKGYFVDFDRLSRILSAICRDGRARIPRLELAVEGGVADAHVENLCSIGAALGLIQKVTYRPTPLGRLVQQYDPFFDDVGTLWCLHYEISSEPRNLIWNRIVTEIIPTRRLFSRNEIRAAFDDLRLRLSASSFRKHVLKEVNAVLDAYTHQQLARLSYLRVDGDNYALGSCAPVPPLVLAASIVIFRDRHRPGETAVAIADILAAQNGPGIVLALDETRLRSALEALKMQDGLSLESRADLDQVRLADSVTEVDWLERYYLGR